MTYPDITLLPQLATYFNISIDELMGYEPQMTKEQIRRGIELTRPARSLKLWLTLQTLGTDQISDMVTHGIDLAQQTESMLRNQPKWEVVTPAQLAIVNFCYAPQGLTPQQQDELNAAISQRMYQYARALKKERVSNFS